MSTPTPTASPAFGKPPLGYRLPVGTRLGRAVLQVADLGRSIAFYEAVIGLAVQERSAGTAVLGAAGGVPFLELRERPGAAPVPRRGRLGLFHFAILLPDRAALGRFIPHLLQRGVQPGMSDHLVSESVYLADPDGLGIEVYADRPRSAWKVRDGELAMATEPLDVEGVVASAAGVPWSGAPAGTVLGHVHLHVASLEEGSAFYHQGMGFDEIVWSYPGALFLSADGYHHHLGVNTWARGAAAAGEDEARLVEWEILVPSLADARAALASAAAHGAAAEATADGGLVRDPRGVGIRLRATSGADG